MKTHAIGGKIEAKSHVVFVYTMVFLRDIPFQWPWHPNAPQDLSDKEIYTHRVALEDASQVWRVPILPPMNGFAYTGYRMIVQKHDELYSTVPLLRQGATDRPMFGLPWDQSVAHNKEWTLLGFPLTHKIIAIGEDGLDLVIHHTEKCWGQVEFVAQRFEDLLEDESDISYIFLNHRTDKVEWILNPSNRMYRPDPMDGHMYRRKAKILPSTLRLFSNNRNPWQDTQLFWNQVNLAAALLE